LSHPRRTDPAISIGTQPIGTQPIGMQPIGTQPIGTQPIGPQPGRTQLVGGRLGNGSGGGSTRPDKLNE
jgi:hypothetical protein